MLPPTYEPGATGHVPEMLELIATLIARGHAYAADDGSGDVYFDVRSWPSYGELTGQKVDDMEPAGDADPRGKRDPRDFALWKGFKKDVEPETAAWPSPYGPGRPGWHIECSAMAGKYLGPAFDIHGGGVDLRFPHHENEQAQSRAAGHPFASYWMHNAWITTAGEKMSKSLGNSLLVPKVLERVRGIELRFYMVSAHYRSHVEFSFEALDEAAVGLPAHRDLPRQGRPAARPARCPRRSPPPWTTTSAPPPPSRSSSTPSARATAAADDRRRRAARRRRCAPCSACSASTRPTRPGARPAATTPRSPRPSTRSSPACSSSAPRRAPPRTSPARTSIRDQIKAAGIEVEDTPTGPKWSVN